MKNNNILKRTVLIIASVALLLPASAQTTRNLTLEEAINLSLQHSNYGKLSQAKVAEAVAALKEARERRLPDLSITGSYLRLTQPTIDFGKKGSPLSGSESGSGSGSSSNPLSSLPVIDQAAYSLTNLAVPVFSGFRIQNGIEAAKYLERAASLDAEKNREEMIENTISAYSNLFKARAALDIVRENLKQSQQRVADLSHLEQNGLLARNDLLKAQLQQSNVELSLLDAENNWKITYITMDLMLGLPEETELVPDSSYFGKMADAGSFDTWETKALQNRKDLAAAEMRKNAAGASVKATKGEYYPSLALTGGYIAVVIPNFLTITNAFTAGAGLKYSPSSLWKTGSKVAQAKARMQQAEISEDILSDNVRLQTAQAYQVYLSSQKKISVYETAVEQANENYRIVKNKYDNSLATTTDLLDADVAQLQAKLNYAFAKADAMVAYNKLLQSAGILADNTPIQNR